MIASYEIKKVHDEEVLFLYLDETTEFAKLKKHKKTTINKEVQDYIKKKNIDFKGKKIVLMASGLLLGTFLLNKPVVNNDVNYNYTPEAITINEEFQYPSFDNIIDVKDDNKEQVEITDNEKEVVKNDANTNINQPVKNEEIKKPQENTKEEIKQEVVKEEVLEEDPSTDEAIEVDVFKQLVRVHRKSGAIIELELEEYLIGVVGAEMPASFRVEALKAQAIAARTFALKTIKEGGILTDTVSTQAYKDNEELKMMWGNSFDTYYQKVRNAVKSTEGLVMTYNNNLINAFYHSTSNGYTEDATVVFGEYPYLKSVESEVDKNVSSYYRTVSFTYQELSQKLNIPITELSSVNITKNASNRVDAITIDNNIFSGVKFRTLLGLRSADFDLILNEENVTITTRGYGHGVGMSQYGANEYAKLGYSYDKILKHYYTGINIVKI